MAGPWSEFPVGHGGIHAGRRDPCPARQHLQVVAQGQSPEDARGLKATANAVPPQRDGAGRARRGLVPVPAPPAEAASPGAKFR